jgi:hypothetical protein
MCSYKTARIQPEVSSSIFAASPLRRGRTGAANGRSSTDIMLSILCTICSASPIPRQAVVAVTLRCNMTVRTKRGWQTYTYQSDVRPDSEGRMRRNALHLLITSDGPFWVQQRDPPDPALLGRACLLKYLPQTSCNLRSQLSTTLTFSSFCLRSCLRTVVKHRLASNHDYSSQSQDVLHYRSSYHSRGSGHGYRAS